MYLYNKNVLEYVQIAQRWPKSIIRDIEGCSIKYSFKTWNYFCNKWKFQKVGKKQFSTKKLVPQAQSCWEEKKMGSYIELGEGEL